MAITRNFNGAVLTKPAAATRIEVNLAGGFPLAPTGIVALVGEADGGEPGSSAGVQTFTSEDIASLIRIYKSGPLADAARMLINPGRDARVPNGASLIRVWKTNTSLRATLDLENAAAATLFNLQSRNFGEDENLTKVKIEAGTDAANQRLITVTKGDQKEELSENAADVKMNITYTGAAGGADLTISSGTLAITTNTPSTPADDISIVLAGKTMQQVTELIDANASYTATSTSKSRSFESSENLDPRTTAHDLVASGALDLRANQKEILDIINAESQLIEASRVANIEGIMVASESFMSGAAKGASANSDFQAGFDAFLNTRINTVVPLVSQDASALLALGETDPASTFTVDAVNLQALTHCLTASNTKNKSERNCYVSKKTTFANAQDAAQDLNSERASMLFQDVEVLGIDGNLKFVDPWGAAVITAGVQAGTPAGTPTTFKGINVNGVRHADYNEKTQVDLAIQNGLTPLEAVDSGGFRIVVGNTTYNKDANFVFNRTSVLEASDQVAFNLRQQLEAIFIGNKAVTGTADAIRNTVISIMSTFLNDELIVGDDTNEGLGWKDLTVTITGNTAFIDITITPVQGIDFILATITLDDIRQTA